MVYRPVLFLATAILAGCSTAPSSPPVAESKPQAPREQFRLRATVTDLHFIADSMFSGIPPGYIRADYDCMMGLALRVISITPSLAGFEKGRTVFFAIHSPTFVFRSAEDPKGRTYDFVLSRPAATDEFRVWHLEVARPNQAMKPTATTVRR